MKEELEKAEAWGVLDGEMRNLGCMVEMEKVRKEIRGGLLGRKEERTWEGNRKLGSMKRKGEKRWWVSR